MKIAILGCGDIARAHIPFIKAESRHRIVGVCDADPARAGALAKTFGIDHVYGDLAELIDRQRPDVVHVLTPPQSHAGLAALAMRRGCHVLVEKPMALSVDEADTMMATARAHGVRLCVNHNQLFDPVVLRARRLVEEGFVDTERVGVYGGSYGGFMSAWAVTQTDRFKASIPLAAVTDWRSFHHTTNIGRFDALFLDADPFEVGGEYDARSPVVQAKNCKTPTLMVHGEEDLCVPVSQAQEMYQALIEAGCETELVPYPREGHGYLEREHQLDLWERMRDWFARHLG